MQLSFLLPVLAGALSVAAQNSGRSVSRMALSKIMERQTHDCTPVTAPVTCERSCGSDYRQCVSFPNCFNPAAGQLCCSDGTYCDAGTFCTDAGCCVDGTPLSQCGASVSLATLPPIAAPTDASPTSPDSTPVFTDSSTVETPSAYTTPQSNYTGASYTTTYTPQTTYSSLRTHTPLTTPAPFPTASSVLSPTATQSQIKNDAGNLHGSLAGMALGAVGLVALML